ncbi:MAG: hypothetical protein AAGI52_10565 [Bacteroidota bacterium]
MSYLFFQILFCLLLAFLLGVLIGWLLRRSRPADCEEVEADLAKARARITDLENRLQAAQAEAAEIAEPPAAAGAATSSGVPMALFGAPAETPVDDLKVISGIGPVIEKQLAGIGVTTYQQIANFTAEDVERVNDAIEVFQGRIEREEWIPQAAKLHREAYGTEP